MITRNLQSKLPRRSLDRRRIYRRSLGISSARNVPQLECEAATTLVDRLLETTRNLMKDDAPQQHTVAFSGGVDSSLVAALVHRVGLEKKGVSTQAVLGLSPAVPTQQRALAESVANSIGIDFCTVHTTEGNEQLYIENNGQACLACKTNLYDTLYAVYKQTNRCGILYNGTNLDDTKDPTRLGLIAAKQFRVQSPLISIPKSDVRVAAKHLGLWNWNHAASPCLRSRLALGVQATKQHLKTIERAEDFVKTQLQLPETTNMRVRMLVNRQACLEIDGWFVKHAEIEYKANQRVWDALILGDLEFASFCIRAFKSGSVSAKEEPDEVVVEQVAAVV